MALRALVSKLRVLPDRAAASRAFASQLEKQCPKCSREARSFDEIMKESRRHNMEKIARMNRNSAVGIVLGIAAVGAVAFFDLCLIEALFDDDL